MLLFPQPYLDSQSLANKKIQHYSEQIKNPNLGERIKNESKEQHLYWGCLLMEAKDVIVKFYVEHQAEIVSIFQGRKCCLLISYNLLNCFYIVVYICMLLKAYGCRKAMLYSHI